MNCWSVLTAPYYCAKGSFAVAAKCVFKPETTNIRALADDTRKFASSGMIDPTGNMFNDRVFIYHGTKDTRILPGQAIVLISDISTE